MADDTDALRVLLLDAFGRIRELVESTTDGLSPEVATYRPDPDANTVAWLVWHLTRVQDSHLSELAGRPQVWTEQGFADRFELPFSRGATGYGQSPEEVGAVTVPAAELRAYHAAVDAVTTDFLRDVTAADLGRIVDEDWDPPVTMSARLVSVLGDCLQHLGQAAYLRGLAEGD
ncbi:mycothiol transferase [Nakamurella deserti]|uniref:mycothiol transferase n=1 Tax=Nakamurella deserti TaxID=2164074 RepID=UPI000DBE0FC5|nr:DUF664 domain-containing protein [Nakamurella deserti]